MSESIKALINPDLLKWAREYCNLGIDQAELKTGFKKDKLESWEQGETKPSINQIRKLAHIYNQTIAVFYLSQRPNIKMPKIKDYRRFLSLQDQPLSYEISKEIQNSINRREIFLELMELMGGKLKIFNEITDLSKNPEKVGEKIRDILNIDFGEQKKIKDSRKSFNFWREKIQDYGSLVFQTSDVPLDLMRGYSIFFEQMPIIGVNRKDPYTARTFSLIHEFTHLLLRSNGLCDIETGDGRNDNDQKIEVFCNHVAGAALVPVNYFYETIDNETRFNISKSMMDSEFEKVAHIFGVSREVITRRMLTFNLVTNDYYEKKREQFTKEYLSIPKKTGFVPPSTNIISLAGKPYVRIVINSFNSNKITSSDLSDYLGVKLKHIGKIEKILFEIS